MKRINCDKCGSLIENGKCSCGLWYEDHEKPLFTKQCEVAMESFNELYKKGQIGNIMSGDHHSGTCIIMFKGDYDDCMVVKDFIVRMNNE